MQSVSILIVDSFKPFREVLCDIIAGSTSLPHLRIFNEANDGIEAVEKAEELRPDLIVLDVTLPRLDGIQVARQIRAKITETKILFVSQQHSPALVRKALSVGAHGYVIKSEIALELLYAVHAVMRGQRYISGRVKHCDLTDLCDT